jgi:trigger factor
MNRKKKTAGMVAILCVLAAAIGAAVMYYTHRDDLDTEYLTLEGYRHLTVTAESQKEVSEEAIEEAIADQLEEQNVYKKITDEKVANGDTINITFQGYLDGKKKKSDMAGSDYDLEVGSKTFVDGFEKGLIGKKPGKKITLNLKFPESYSNENYAGHKVKFIVTINYIKKNYTKDTLTDEIVKQNMEFDSVDALYENARTLLEDGEKKAFEEGRTEKLWEKLLKKTKIKKYNESYLKKEEEEFDDRYELHAKSLNITMQEFITDYCNYSMEEYEDLKEESAKEATAKKMIAEAIAKRERITGDSYKDTLSNVEKLLLEKTQFQYK